MYRKCAKYQKLMIELITLYILRLNFRLVRLSQIFVQQLYNSVAYPDANSIKFTAA